MRRVVPRGALALVFAFTTACKPPPSAFTNASPIAHAARALYGVLADLDSMNPGAEFAGFLACDRQTIGACDDGHRTHVFSGCHFGASLLEGRAAVAYTRRDCAMTDEGATMTRTFEATLTDASGARFALSTGLQGSEVVTKLGTGFSLRVSGLRRASLDADPALEAEVHSSEDLRFESSATLGRSLNGGTLVSTDLVNSESLLVTPSQVTWYPTCNCPAKGTFAPAPTSDGSSSTLLVIDCSAAHLERRAQPGLVDENTVGLDVCGGR